MGKRFKRALKHHTHGMNIYAYKHIHTSQVVYSLSRIMQSSQIMPQLIFHGKKTVPAALRRDLWRPYFSIHYPDNALGARAGLIAYSMLRKLSLQRQLRPPERLLIATQEDLEKAKRAAGDPADVCQKLLDHKLKLPMVGQLLPQKLRARKLMDQKATSVADVAHVLEKSLKSFTEIGKKVSIPASLAVTQRLQEVGYRRRRTLRRIYKEESEKAEEWQEREELFAKSSVGHGEMPLDRHVARQLNIEHGAGVFDANPISRLRDIQTAKQGSVRPRRRIHVLWADMRDGTYARSWPEGVYHDILHPVAYEKTEASKIIQHKRTDKDGVVVSEQRQRKMITIGASPHIIGRENTEPYHTQRTAHKEFAEEKKEAIAEGDRAATRRQLPILQRKQAANIDAYEDLMKSPRYAKLSELDSIDKESMSTSEREELDGFETRKAELQQTLQPLIELESKYPDITHEVDRIVHWQRHIKTLRRKPFKKKSDEKSALWKFVKSNEELPPKIYRDGRAMEGQSWDSGSSLQDGQVGEGMEGWKDVDGSKGAKAGKKERGWLSWATGGRLGS